MEWLMPENFFTYNDKQNGYKNRSKRQDDGYYDEEPSKPVFNVQEPFMGVINVQMNESFASLLCNLLGDIDGGLEPEIWAFKKALADPQGCKDFREKKRRSPQSHHRHDNDNFGE